MQKGIFVSLAFLSSLAISSVASANSYELCLRYTADMVDGDVGEDYYTTSNNWTARGAKVKVYVIQGGISVNIFDGYASRTDGCVTVPTAATSGKESLTVLMYPQARVQYLSSGNYVYVKAKSPTISENQAWVTYTTPLADGQTYYVNSGSDALSRLMAVGDYAVYRWFKENTGFPSSPSLTLWMENDNCQGSSSQPYACMSQGKVWVPTVGQRTQRKFLVSHEIGHWLYRQYGGSFPYQCDEDPNENYACSFHGSGTSRSHALQMKVPDNCALTEGFAHFFATDVFNAHSATAYFDYYKDTYPGQVNVEQGPTGGDTGYMEENCVSPSDGWSTELDWMRAFWDYHTDSHSGSSEPSHQEIFEHMKDAYSYMAGQADMYHTAREGMVDGDSSTPSLRARFDDDAEKNGICAQQGDWSDGDCTP